jgi:hypothetical protein
MTSLPYEFPNAPDQPAPPARQLPDPSLLRLAHAVADLNPALAHSLCMAGLAAMDDERERETWSVRLASFLEDGPSFGPLPTLPA